MRTLAVAAMLLALFMATREADDTFANNERIEKNRHIFAKCRGTSFCAGGFFKWRPSGPISRMELCPEDCLRHEYMTNPMFAEKTEEAFLNSLDIILRDDPAWENTTRAHMRQIIIP